MKVMVVGSGGREHAIIKSLKKSARVSELFCIPGNAGIALDATCVSIPVTPTDLVEFAHKNHIDFTVVAPDNALADGVVDAFEVAGLKAFGGVKAGAKLEWSKRYAKEIMAKYGIPTAQYQSFTDLAAAKTYAEKHPLPIVIKDSALALGKGVTIAHSVEEAFKALDSIFDRPSGAEVVIEEFMQGMEVSCMAFCDGTRAVMMPASQDHKTIHEGDVGAMTGGMGVIAPFPLTPQQQAQIQQEILDRLILAMQAEGTPFKGVIYPGLMLTDSGVKVVEFNARFGDPEAECLLPLLQTDLLDILEACVAGELNPEQVQFSTDSSAVVIMASPLYPASSTKGIPITISAQLPANTQVFHAGTALQNGQFVSNGGRVLAVQATAATLPEALKAAYTLVDQIEFKGAQVRRDIGFRLGLKTSV